MSREMPLNVTSVAPVNLLPRMITLAPTAPDEGCVFTNECSPTDRLKTVPDKLAPPVEAVPYKLPSVSWINEARGQSPSAQLL